MDEEREERNEKDCDEENWDLERILGVSGIEEALDSEGQHVSLPSEDISDDLGPLRTGPIVIGYVDAVNGKGSELMPQFVPTRHELEHLI